MKSWINEYSPAPCPFVPILKRIIGLVDVRQMGIHILFVYNTQKKSGYFFRTSLFGLFNQIEKMKKLFILSFLICFTMCTPKPQTSDAIFVDLDQPEEASLFNYFRSIELIPLETSSEVLIKVLLCIIYKKNMDSHLPHIDKTNYPCFYDILFRHNYHGHM